MTPPTSSHATALARGSLWVTLGQTVGALAGLVSSIVAAKMLSPNDFGLMGVALMSLATLNALSQTGFDSALVQRKEVDGYIEVAFAVQIIRGSLLALIVLALAFPLSWFYEEPALGGIFAVLATSVLLSGARNVATVVFHRSMDFRTLVFMGIFKALSKLAFVLVLLFWLRSVWALVLGHLFAAVVDVGLSYWVGPRRPRIAWDFSKAKELIRFGKWISMMSILGLLVTRGDDMFVSKYLGMAALGVYTLAYEIANLPATHVTHVVGRVSFPAYARLHDEATRASMRRTFLNVAKATLLITAPLSVLIFCGIEHIITYVLGEKWRATVPLVRILVVAGFFRSIAALATGVFHGAGRPHLDFWMNLPRLALLAVLIWPACAFWGLEGASWLVLLSVLACFPTWAVGLFGILKLRASELLRETALVGVVSALLVACYRISERVLEPDSGWTFAAQVLLALLMWATGLLLLERTTRFRFWDEVRSLGRALRAKSA